MSCVAVCLKWVEYHMDRTLDPAADNGTAPDRRFAGVSAADRAALEWALRCRDAWGSDVVAITVGPAQADAVLRNALAAGATRAIRIDAEFDSPSPVVAALLAGQLGETALVWCGDYSLDRGTGSVPAFLAGELGAAQALGLVEITLGDAATVGALRRLDGGRRERLAIIRPAVLSVEGGTAMLRRAPLRALLTPVSIEVHSSARAPVSHGAAPAAARPFRPRPRALAAPIGASALDRVKSLTAAGAAVAHGETVALDPDAAAERILAKLREWGYAW